MTRTKTRLGVAGLAVLGLALLPLAPAAHATAAPTASCGVDLDVWDLSYACYVDSVGKSGTASWCPDPTACRDGDVLDCHVDLTPPYVCTIL